MNEKGASNALVKIIAVISFCVGLIVFFLFPANKYEWMREIDPSIQTLPEDNSFQNRSIFLLLVLIVVLATQLIFFLKTKSIADRATAAILAMVALAVWLLKYYF